MRIFRETPGLGAHDAVLAAVALGLRMPLATADRAFAGIPGLRVHDPADPAFMRELGLA